MILQELTLQNFRNFRKKSFEFSAKTTVIVGPNTSGKTNLLEAVYLLATGKSFRAQEEKEIISYGEEITRIKGTVDDEPLRSPTQFFPVQNLTQDSLRSFRSSKTGGLPAAPNHGKLEIVLTTGLVGGQPAPHKKYLVNGVPKRMVDFVGNLRAALFWPEDLELVTDSPSLRRKYLDLVLCQIDREYGRSLLAYEKGVRQRNKLLERIRDEGLPRSQLTFWNQLLIKNGNLLTDKRQEYIDFINGANWSNLSNFRLKYDKSLISESRLEQYAQNEVGSGMTLVGPHRDDFKFLLRDRDLSLYGSRGEQRMAVLWLKLGELEFMAEKTGARPILLLDDIFSELDEKHREAVLKIIPNQQTIMTTTDLHLVDQKFLKSAKIIEL